MRRIEIKANDGTSARAAPRGRGLGLRPSGIWNQGMEMIEYRDGFRGGRGWSRRRALDLEALVRFQPPELAAARPAAPRLGRQQADHSRLEREMLRVRIPPEPSGAGPGPVDDLAGRRARRSAEARNPGDGTVRKSAKRPGREPGACGFDSHPCHASPEEGGVRRCGRGDGLTGGAGGGHPPGTFGDAMGGWSNGKTPGLQPGDRGSIPRPVHCSEEAVAGGLAGPGPWPSKACLSARPGAPTPDRGCSPVLGV